MEKKTLWECYTPNQLSELNAVNEDYKACLDQGKTERECVRLSIQKAEAAGYQSLESFRDAGKTLLPGDKVYAVYNEKLLVLWHIGKEDLETGMNILGAHVDSPRIDVKQNPLYENAGFAYLDAHYYGGIKKYQWVTIPLSIHGVVFKKDGTKIELCIGEKEDDPVFAITDILVHLSRAQMEKNASKIIEGENLDLLVGTVPLANEPKDADNSTNMGDAQSKKAQTSEPVRAAVLRFLSKEYDIDEEDFLSAELEIIPAGKARDAGFDHSMVMAYGQDDRICAFTSLMAMLKLKETPRRTACCLLVDKEEIGSVGASGMHSRFFENMIAEILLLAGRTSDISVRRCLQNSRMLSSDVSAGFDPLFADVFETKNSAYLGKGIVFNKYTGIGGKSNSNDANPEYIARIRQIMDENQISFQTAELGRVDAGGGGTIAYIVANYGMEVIDCGLALLCMHAPWEIASKADIYEAVRGYEVFLQNM